MAWYWWLSIFIYVNGASFTAGASIHETVRGELLQTVLLVILWPIAIAGVFYGSYIHEPLVKMKWTKKIEERVDKIKVWYVNRKEDKHFYEKCLDDKFERLGVKFDENDDIWRS